MKIKKGDKFLCIKDVILFDGRGIPYKKGEIYKSECDYCITDISGDKEHTWSERGIIIQQYFKPLSEVDRVYTEATDRLRELHRNFTGAKIGDPDNADHFDNKGIINDDFAFSAQAGLGEIYNKAGYDYVSEEVFIELNGLESKPYDEDPYSWVNNGIREAIPVKKTFNPQPHYDNSKGSLYKVATERGWSSYIFDVVKRLERGGKKDPLRQEIEKSIDVLKIWLNELPEENS